MEEIEALRKDLCNKVAICLWRPAERTNREEDAGDRGRRQRVRWLLSLNFRGKASRVNERLLLK